MSSRVGSFLKGQRPAAFDAAGLGAALSAFASSPEAARIARTAHYLDSGRAIDGYLGGGCFLLAEAFGRWAGPAAELLALKTFDDAGAYPEMDHVVARIGDHYFDADGARGEAELVAHYDEVLSEGHWLAPFTREDAERDGIGCEAAPLGALSLALRGSLGDPARWNVPAEDDKPGGWWEVRVMPAARGGDLRGILAAAGALGIAGADVHGGGVSLLVRERDRATLTHRLASTAARAEWRRAAQHAPGGPLPLAYRPRWGDGDDEDD